MFLMLIAKLDTYIMIRMLYYVMFHLQTNPSLIELVKGYGVKCTQRQLDEVESNSSGSATKMIRNFMDAFFTEKELGQSSCYGS